MTDRGASRRQSGRFTCCAPTDGANSAPLTNANLSLEPQSETVDQTPITLGWNLESSPQCGFPQAQQSDYLASTDVELSLSAPAPTKNTLRLSCGD